MAPQSRSRIAALAPNRIGVIAVLAYVLSSVAPMLVTGGLIPVSYAITGIESIPFTLMVVAVLIAIMETLIRYAADRGMPLPTAFTAAPAFLALATVGPIAKWIDLRFIAPRPAGAPARHQALGSHA